MTNTVLRYWKELCTMLMRIDMSVDFFHDFNTCVNGTLGILLAACALRNSGDSSTCERTYVPMITSTKLRRNGTRHTQVSKAFVPATAARNAMTPEAVMMPTGPDALIQDAKNPRLPDGAFSIVRQTAFMYSPPSASPCRKRKATSAMGAQMPIVA